MPEDANLSLEASRLEIADYVDKMIEEIHGSVGVEMFDKLYERLKDENPQITLEEALKKFEEEPTHGQTDWFRGDNLREVAEDLVERLEKKDGEEIKVGIVGCSTGEEVWSLAVLLKNAGRTDVAILATDTSPNRIEFARSGKYKAYVTPQQFGKDAFSLHRGRDDQLNDAIKKGYIVDSGERWKQRQINHKYSVREIVDDEKAGLPRPSDLYIYNDHVVMEPSVDLRGGVNFEVHDIIDGPFTVKQDVIIINNVLVHFPDATRNKMLSHLIDSLNPRGFIVMERTPRPMRKEEAGWLAPYGNWRRSITNNFSLEAVRFKVGYSKEPIEFDGYYQLKGKDS